MTLDDLDQWMFLSGTSEQRLARMVGVGRATVYGWRRRQHRPSEQDCLLLNTAILCRDVELIKAVKLGAISESYSLVR